MRRRRVTPISTIPTREGKRKSRHPRRPESGTRRQAPAIAVNASLWEAPYESQTVRPVSLYAAGLGKPLRSRCSTSRLREVRRQLRHVRQALSPRSPKEATMRNDPQHYRNGAAKRCASCDGKFGLIRYYCWRTPLCSKACVGRFRTRQESDRRWLIRFRAA